MKAKTQSKLRCLLNDIDYVGTSSGIMIRYLGVFCCCCPLLVPFEILLREFLIDLSIRWISHIFILCLLLWVSVLFTLPIVIFFYERFLPAIFPSLKCTFLLLVRIFLSCCSFYFVDIQLFPVYVFLISLSNLIITNFGFISYYFLWCLFLYI